MGHLGQGTSITTVQDKEIVLTSTTGQMFKMNITDLAEAVRQVMLVATPNREGLVDRGFFMYRGEFDYKNTVAVNALIASGIYRHGDDIEGTSGGYGVLIVFDAGYYIVQIDFTFNGKTPYRFSPDRGFSWTKWMSISFT